MGFGRARCAVHSLISGETYGYVYDGNGDRIAKGTLSSFNCNLSSNGFAIQNAYVVGQAGEQLSEMGSTQNWLHMNVFAGGRLVATYEGGTTYFALSDWLGTKRVETVPNGTCLSTYASLAYGDELTPSGTCPDATEHHYTTKEHDGESGNDFFLARYYSSTAGRFISPDWASGAEAVPYAKFGDPQSLNLYAYTIDNPLSRMDKDGHCPICAYALEIAGGAAAGAVIGAGVEATADLISGKRITAKGIEGAAVQGAFTGAVAAATEGTSLVSQTAAQAGANLIGGIVGREATGKKETAKDAVVDTVSGAAGPLASKLGASLRRRSMANLRSRSKTVLDLRWVQGMFEA
jgi:RHS repeat-associated protein